MSYANGYESLLWKLLEKEQLADLSQFHRAHCYDEVPLYSRDADVAFLPASRSRASAVLLRFSLKFLKAVISYGEPRTPFFAAITIWNGADEDLLVPNLFVWSGPVSKLKRQLKLAAPASPFAKDMRRQLSRLPLGESFKLREDSATDPEVPRVFVAPSRRPYPAFITLDDLRGTIRPGSRLRVP